MKKVIDESNRIVIDATKVMLQKPHETTTSDSDSAPVLANNLAKEVSSLRTEVGELSKVVRKLADKKPEEHAGIANLQTMLVAQDAKK
ncbi:MAG: hypothetical protein ACRYE7_02765 [Janthinobacterium lividum]